MSVFIDQNGQEIYKIGDKFYTLDDLCMEGDPMPDKPADLDYPLIEDNNTQVNN